MTQSLKRAPVSELVKKFVMIALAQEQAVLLIANAKYNRLYRQMKAVEAKLKSFDPDERRALLPLLQSPNLWVRYRAGIATLAIAPTVARSAIESVRDSRIYQQSAEAASTLSGLDEGKFDPS